LTCNPFEVESRREQHLNPLLLGFWPLFLVVAYLEWIRIGVTLRTCRHRSVKQRGPIHIENIFDRIILR
jgi:hypothetical protein